MAVYLTPSAILKIMTGKCTQNDLKPVLQVIYIDNKLSRSIKDKQWCGVWLSDGSFWQFGLIADEIFISNKLQKGDIVQLTKFQLSKFQLTKPFTTSKGEILSQSLWSYIRVCDLNLLRSKCDIIGHPKLLPCYETPLVERTTPTIRDEDHANSHHVEEPPSSKQKQDHVDSLLNEDIDDVEEPPTSIHYPSTSTQKCSSHFLTSKQKQDRVDPDLLENIDDSRHVEEPPTSKQNPSTSTKKCSSHSTTQNNKRKFQSSNDAISMFGKDISDVMKMMVEITNDVRVLYKKSETLEEGVSKLTRMVMEKSKEDDMGACIEKLDKIGWVAQDPMYDTALLLFSQSADNRKLWLHLKPESCGNWVKNAGSMFGLLDYCNENKRKRWLHLKPESCGKWVKNIGKVEPLCYVLGLGRMHKLFL
ncbi:L10-interacting MYB domain-containing protein-like protein [Tanacetum coccineum]